MKPDKFMSIGAGCLSIYILPKDRLRGPVDNVRITDPSAIDLLLDGEYCRHIANSKPSLEKKAKWNHADPEFDYVFDCVSVVHNIFDAHYLENVKARETTLVDFYKSGGKFVFTLNKLMVNQRTGKLKGDLLVGCLDKLRERKLLNRVILVGAKGSGRGKGKWYDCWLSKDAQKQIAGKYGIKYIQLKDVDFSIPGAKAELHKKFEQALDEKQKQKAKAIKTYLGYGYWGL